MNAEPGSRGLVGEERPRCGGVHRGMREKENCGMYVNGRMGGVRVEMLIDSGANVSLISCEVYDRLDALYKPTLRRYGTPMVTADGTLMKVYGSGEFVFDIGDEACMYGHELCVADIGVEAILGYDFLMKYEAVISMGQGKLELNELCMVGPGNEVNKRVIQECEIIVNRTIMIPAGGEAIAQGRGLKVSGEFVGMIEPVPKMLAKHCLLVARAAVTVGVGDIPVRIFNSSEAPVTIYKNTVAATCMEVEVIPGLKCITVKTRRGKTWDYRST
jgi:hypothetical protein